MVTAEMYGDRDPGYGWTARAVLEAGLCLALQVRTLWTRHCYSLPKLGAQLTIMVRFQTYHHRLVEGRMSSSRSTSRQRQANDASRHSSTVVQTRTTQASSTDLMQSTKRVSPVDMSNAWQAFCRVETCRRPVSSAGESSRQPQQWATSYWTASCSTQALRSTLRTATPKLKTP